MKIPQSSKKDLREYWDVYQQIYEDFLETNLLPFHSSLLNQIKIKTIRENDNILELSVGTGLGFQSLVTNTITKNVNLYGGDISDKMVKATLKKIIPFTSITKRKPIVKLIDNCDLHVFNDNFFRSVYSNLSLHVVEDPLKMLKEVRRVCDETNPDCRVAFNVPKDSDSVSLFTLLDNMFLKRGYIKKYGVKNQFVFNRQNTTKLFEDAGFRNVYIGNERFYFNFETFKDIEFYFISPNYDKIIRSMDKASVSEFMAEAKDTFDNYIKLNGKCFEELMLITASC